VKSRKPDQKRPSELRKRAEKKLTTKKTAPKAMSDKETQQLIHELQVHQIELEMQNEDLRRSQAELEESRTKYSDLYDFAPVSYFTFDKDGLILEANLTAAKELGRERSLLMNKPFRSYIIPEDREIFDQCLPAVFKSADRQICEIRLKRKDGSEFYAQLESMAVNDLNDNPLCRTSVTDVTRYKKTEETMKKLTDELKRSNEDLKQFASAASHDLQEPLRGIESFIRLLEKRYKGKLDEKADEYIDYVVNDVKRMQMLIQDLLEYSRVSVKDKVFSPVNCSVALEQALHNLRSAIEESGAEVTYDLLPILTGDEAQLCRLFQNLIGNAIKFRSKEPVKIHISAHREATEWIFSIRDTGIGIDPTQAERIFVIFQRLHSRQEYAGTGVGLAICKRIVGRHGGRIWVESEHEKGATFYFTIPDRQGNLSDMSEKEVSG
jgi:two-component system, chemotaxis family, sensor kinase Cph1